MYKSESAKGVKSSGKSTHTYDRRTTADRIIFFGIRFFCYWICSVVRSCIIQQITIELIQLKTKSKFRYNELGRSAALGVNENISHIRI